MSLFLEPQATNFSLLWYSFWDDTLWLGPGQVKLEAPLERIGLLVRAGSILPMEEEKQLILHLYPPMQGTSFGCLYSDAGDGYGEWRLDKFRMVRLENGLELFWEQQGDYAFPYNNICLNLHGLEVQQAWVDEKEVTFEGNRLDCNLFMSVSLRGEFAATAPP